MKDQLIKQGVKLEDGKPHVTQWGELSEDAFISLSTQTGRAWHSDETDIIQNGKPIDREVYFTVFEGGFFICVVQGE